MLRHSNVDGIAPVIIIGSPRSGTTLLTSMLQQLGMFVGHKLDENREAIFFQSINDWLLRQSGGAWDNPEAIQYFYASLDDQLPAKNYIRSLMQSPRASQFLGFKKSINYQDIRDLDFFWGWKDPRNTYTLPLWLDVFPNAKVIHISRHGLDVANSLHVRSQKILNNILKTHERRKWVHFFKLKQGGFADSYRCNSLEGSFQVWEEYIQTARKHVQFLGNQAIEIQYEQLLLSPVEVLTSLVQFVGLKVTRSDLQKITGQLQGGRAYAFKKDEKLQIFGNQILNRLEPCGY
jgi:hypothetical protein